MEAYTRRKKSFNGRWKLWCRLCASEDSVGNINIFRRTESEAMVKSIAKYFHVNILYNTELPQTLCAECFSLVASFSRFAGRVAKVQEMFEALRQTAEVTDTTLSTLYGKYGLDDEEQHLSEAEVLYLEAKPKLANDEHNEINIYDLPIMDGEDEEACDFQYIDESCDLNETEIKVECTESEDTAVHETPPPHAKRKKPNCRNELKSTLESVEITNTKSRRAFDATQIYELLSTGKPLSLMVVAKSLDDNDELNADDPLNMEILHWLEHPDDFGLYTCTACQRKFKEYNGFRQHLKRSHSLAPKLKCPKCTQEYAARRDLKGHLRMHLLPLELRKTLPCPNCDKKFATKGQLRIHINRVHLAIRAVICEECGSSFHSNSELKAHMLCHTDEAPHSCEICSKRFKNKRRLKDHLERHSERPLHMCEECGFQAQTRKSLWNHRICHSNVYPHNCDHCGRRFKRAEELRNHLICHTGMKPFKCEFCDNAYTNNPNLRNHKKKAHPKELEEAGVNAKRNQNIPKLEELKAVVKVADHLVPVVPTKDRILQKLTKKQRRQKKLMTMEEKAKASEKCEKLLNNILDKTGESEQELLEELEEEHLFDEDSVEA